MSSDSRFKKLAQFDRPTDTMVGDTRPGRVRALAAGASARLDRLAAAKYTNRVASAVAAACVSASAFLVAIMLLQPGGQQQHRPRPAPTSESPASPARVRPTAPGTHRPARQAPPTRRTKPTATATPSPTASRRSPTPSHRAPTAIPSPTDPPRPSDPPSTPSEPPSTPAGPTGTPTPGPSPSVAD